MSPTLKKIEGEIFDRKADWDNVDVEKALKNKKILELLHEACLVESYLPSYIGKVNRLFWNDLEATAIFNIESFEAYGHYYMIRRYLDIVGYNPIRDEEVLKLRESALDEEFDDQIRELVNFMGTEHFAAEFFKDLQEITEEPVLKSLLPQFAKEEISHSQFAFDLLKRRIDEDPSLKNEVYQKAQEYKHIGEYAIPFVHAAKEDNIRIIMGFDDKVEALVGKGLGDA